MLKKKCKPFIRAKKRKTLKIKNETIKKRRNKTEIAAKSKKQKAKGSLA